jgi:hypothetical protein
MARLLRLTLSTLLFAAPVLFALAPRPAHAFCIGCDEPIVIEYRNAFTGHYLLLPDGDPEVAFVEGGGAGPGWERTGNDFVSSSLPGTMPVCRFYSPVFNTHFYTADAAECELVKHNSDWVYEKTAFPVYLPSPGQGCTTSVFRVYLAGDHRYTADAALRDSMLAKGWADEGVAWCAVSGGRNALTTIEVQAYFPDPVPGCQAEGGDCIALDSLAPMPNRVFAFLPPDFITPNPAYPPGVNAIIGSSAPADIDTSQPAGDLSAILKHSFTSPQGGLYLVGRDRLGGNYARIMPMAQLPRVFVPPGDQRMFVWRTASDRELRVSANVFVGVVAQDGPGSHAYGATTLQFTDAVSGHAFRMTVQAYGTVPPGDFAAPDARSGEPIVSTVFRANPAFGRVLSGAFIPCKGDGSACAPQSVSTATIPFTFSLQRADFQTVLDQARAIDPALTGIVANYFLSRVAFNNETYLDARLGATVTGLTAQVWYVE